LSHIRAHALRPCHSSSFDQHKNVFSFNVPTRFLWHYGHFVPTCFDMTVPSSGGMCQP
jgi:hypothetical protein